MGVIYKLKPEIRDFILEQKKANPILSCRGLAVLIECKFQIKVSKSSINTLTKETGLSQPVGRRPKKRRQKAQIPALPQIKAKVIPLELGVKEPIQLPPPIEKEIERPLPVPVDVPVEKPALEVKVEAAKETQGTGAILLKAADYLIGGSSYIYESAKSRLRHQEIELLAKIESLIYLPLFELHKESTAKDLSDLWSLIGKEVPLEDILAYHNDLQRVRTITVDLLHFISTMSQEVSAIKVNLSDGGILYLDGQLRTVWSTQYIPNDFAVTLYNIKGYINKHFYGNAPLILFTAPGDDLPTQEFFNFILSFTTQEKRISKLNLYGQKFEELEVIFLAQHRERTVIFGLWPGQFAEYCKVNKIGEYQPFHFEPLKKDFLIAEIEVELSQPNIRQSVTLKGCLLKTSLTEKARLVILGNLSEEAALAEKLARHYLSQWPNLEEAFQDYRRKIEFFTYTSNAQRSFSVKSPNLKPEILPDTRTFFDQYLKALDLYVRLHFLPLGYEKVSFSTTKERFYQLKATLKKAADYTIVTFQPPGGYPFLKDLDYACRRLNERAVAFTDGKRLWFTPTPIAD